MPQTDSDLDVPAIEALNDALRRVMSATRTTTAPTELLAEAREELERIEAKLGPYAHPGPYSQGALGPMMRGLDSEVVLRPAALFPYSPVIGPRNPIAPPIEFEVVEGAVRATAVFDPLYAGPPGPPHGSVHGGIVALVLDELLGYANVAAQLGAMTGTLIVRYLRPTPIGVPIRMEARSEGRDGRKVFAQGRLWAGEQVTAEAEGVFVQASFKPQR